MIGAWAHKCFEASQAGALVVLLAPARPDTRWFHHSVQGKAEVTFVRGRLRFGHSENSAPFPSMLAVYAPNRPATICARCGNGFIGRSDARACSNACRQWLYRNRISLQLKCNEAVALTEATAAIENPDTGAITTYCRFNKPALGPPGRFTG